jgi:hypothetical protein
MELGIKFVQQVSVLNEPPDVADIHSEFTDKKRSDGQMNDVSAFLPFTSIAAKNTKNWQVATLAPTG